MEPIKSPREGDMARLTSESKITGKQSLRPVRSSLIYVPMPPTNELLYEAAVGKFYAEGASVEGNTQYM